MKTVRRYLMNQRWIRRYKYIFISFLLLFVIFFISTNAIENYLTSKKLLLFVNGSEHLSNDEIQNLKIKSITYGIWNEEKNLFETNDKYILMRMKSREVIFSTNNIKEIIEYTNMD
jgi:ABC-type uncharacterized transport system permease subunit